MVDKSSDTKEKILKTAISIFREKGKDGAKMQEIADGAGINKAMLHYYFSSKDQLFQEVFKITAVAYFSNINKIVQSNGSIEEKIGQLCQVYIDMALQNPYMPVFMIAEMHRSPSDFFKHIFSDKRDKPDLISFKKQIEEEVLKGKIKPIKPMQLIFNILSLCVFPVVSRPMMQFVGSISDKEFVQMMEERKKLVPQLIWSSIQKN
jgi:AcrR family transcriptional regulator